MNSILFFVGSFLFKNLFFYGIVMLSFQIEGDVDNCFECIWDRFCEWFLVIVDYFNGDVVCDYIVCWREDFDILLNLNVDVYCFFIFWLCVII